MFKKGRFLALFIGIFALGMVIAGPTWAAGTISGTLVAAHDSTPIASYRIGAVNSMTDSVYSGITSDTGTYAVSVPAGTYEVSNSYYGSDHPTTDAHKKYIISSQTVTVADGETQTINFSATLRGRFIGGIYRNDNVTALTDVIVSVYNYNGSVYGSGSDVTSDDGLFYVTPVPSDNTTSAIGAYYMNINKSGYFSKQISNLNLSTDAVDISQNINLTAASTIAGQVLDTNSVAIPTADVYVTKTGGSTYDTVTDASGNFTLSINDSYPYNGTAIGSYTMYISKNGYVTQIRNFSITADESSLTGYNFSLALGGIMNGYVYASDGVTPISSATISATDGYGNSYSATSNYDGSYSLIGLRTSDKYTVTVAKTGYVTQKLYNYSALVGETKDAQNFSLAATVAFSGIVTDKDGNVIEDADIYLYNRAKLRTAGSDFSGATVTDGTFSLINIVPNKYRAVIMKNGYVTKTVEILDLNSDVSGKTYQLTSEAVIYGRVTHSGDPVKGAAVYIYSKGNEDDQGYNATTTDSDGYYIMSGLKKGTYQIKVVTTAYAEKIVTKKLKAGHEKTLNIKLGKGGSFSGYVWDKETNLPISGIVVRLKGISGIAATDSNGYYYFDGIAKGKYKPYIMSINYKTNYHSQIKVKANQVKEDVNFTLVTKEE